MVTEGPRFSPYDCTLRPRAVVGITTAAFLGAGGICLIAIAAARRVPHVLSSVMSASQATTFWYGVGALCVAVAAFGVGASIYQQRRPKLLRIDRDHLLVREVATGGERVVRYADITQASRTVQARVRLLVVRHPGGELRFHAGQFPSNEVFDQAARLIIERTKAARAQNDQSSARGTSPA